MLIQLSNQLKHRLTLPLPGNTAHLQMMHAERKLSIALQNKIPEEARLSAVLVLLYEENNKIKLPLILRKQYPGVHSGQVSLPGGKFEKEDAALSVTAIREAEEEIGITKSGIEIIGKLSELYIPPSNFHVHPFVAVASGVPSFVPQTDEVEKIIILDLDTLQDDSIVSEKEITISNGMKIIAPVFTIENHGVWGATAMILSELKVLLRELES